MIIDPAANSGAAGIKIELPSDIVPGIFLTTPRTLGIHGALTFHQGRVVAPTRRQDRAETTVCLPAVINDDATTCNSAAKGAGQSQAAEGKRLLGRPQGEEDRAPASDNGPRTLRLLLMLAGYQETADKPLRIRTGSLRRRNRTADLLRSAFVLLPRASISAALAFSSSMRFLVLSGFSKCGFTTKMSVRPYTMTTSFCACRPVRIEWV